MHTDCPDQSELPILPEGMAPGRAHVADLCTIRIAMGALWSSMREGVRGRLERIIARCLGPSDSYRRLDDERYLIITPAATDDEGAVLVLRILVEFFQTLNGGCDLDDIRIASAEPGPDAGLQIIPIPPPDLARLAEKANLQGIMLPRTLRGLAMQSDKDAPAEPVMRRGPLTVSHHFEPLWDAPNQAVTTYICAPKAIICADAQEAQLQPDDLNPRERSMVEMAGLMKGVGYLSKFIEAGDRFLLCMPFSFETLSSPYGRMEFVRTCRGMPIAYRQYLMFFLADVPLGVTQSRLSELALVLKPYGRIVASVPDGCRNFAAYNGHGFSGLALDLARMEENVERRRAAIAGIGAAAADMGCGATILNLDDPQLLPAVDSADFRFLHGSIIAPPQAEPKRMTRLETGAIFRSGEHRAPPGAAHMAVS
jgi:hypothetical protein